jgi:hypothetical protein
VQEANQKGAVMKRKTSKVKAVPTINGCSLCGQAFFTNTRSRICPQCRPPKISKPLTVGQLIARLRKFHPRSLVRLDVPVGPDDFNPTPLWDTYDAHGDTICGRDNGAPLSNYRGVTVHSGDVILQGMQRYIIQGPQPQWNAKTSNWCWAPNAKKLMRAIRQQDAPSAKKQKATMAKELKTFDAANAEDAGPDVRW